MKTFRKKGFTLVELLIMTTIIIIIIIVLLIGLNSTRMKSKDVAIITEINSALTAVELETGALGRYIGVCDLFETGKPLERIKISIENKGGVWESCKESINSYSILILLNSGQHAFNLTNIIYALDSIVKNTDVKIGIHESVRPILFDRQAMRRLRNYAKENSKKIVSPTYYCVGAKPPYIDGGNFVSGYIYNVSREDFSGCGIPVGYTEEEINSAAIFSGSYKSD